MNWYVIYTRPGWELKIYKALFVEEIGHHSVWLVFPVLGYRITARMAGSRVIAS